MLYFYFDFIVSLILLSSLPIIFLILIILIFFTNKKYIILDYMRENMLSRKRDIFALVVTIALTFFSAIVSISYWRDLPYVMTGNFPVSQGIITKKTYTTGRGSHILVRVNNNTYNTNNTLAEYPPTGTFVIVKYIPNTKIICTITTK